MIELLKINSNCVGWLRVDYPIERTRWLSRDANELFAVNLLLINFMCEDEINTFLDIFLCLKPGFGHRNGGLARKGEGSETRSNETNQHNL